MKTALVLGGTSFFGRELVNQLLLNNYSVTLFTRGQKSLDFDVEGNIDFVKGDRSRFEDFKFVSQAGFDLIFDQIGFSSQDAKRLVDAVGDNAGRIVFTSSQSVYEAGENILESSVDPNNHSIQLAERDQFEYGEGKRQAEAYYFQHSKVPITIVRPSLVFGENDKSKRLKYHVDRISSGRAFHLPNPEAVISMLYSKDAGKAILAIGEQSKKNEVFNLSSGQLRLQVFMRTIANAIEGRINYSSNTSGDNYSPYGATAHWWMNRDKVSKFIPRTDSDLIKVIEEMAKYEIDNQS